MFNYIANSPFLLTRSKALVRSIARKDHTCKCFARVIQVWKLPYELIETALQLKANFELLQPENLAVVVEERNQRTILPDSLR